jgi:LysW-gamma-L-lysine carboxypeptidase
MIDPVALLHEAVSIPSVSGEEALLARYLVEQMAAFADEACVDGAGNAVARLGRGALTVYLLGHIDTVPGAVPVRLADGKLYGRGAVDAKGAFCTAMAAASRLPAWVLERLTLRLIGATEEEAPSSKGARYAVAHYPKPDMVIIGEPSGWEAVTLGYKGRLIAKLKLAKPNFHSAGEGTTAAEDMVALWQRLAAHAAAYNRNVSGVFDQLQISLQAIASCSDGLTQCAEATVGYRLPPAMSPEALAAELHELAPVGALHTSGHEVAYRGDKDSPLARAFRLAIRAEQGRARLKVKTGTSDMNVVAPHWSVPMLAYGPGDSAFDHRPDEQLELAEYKKAIAVLTTALIKLAEAQSPDNS